MRRSFLALALLCCGALAQTQSPFPSKPIRVIVTSPSGGANDILNRTLGAKLSESIGQPVLIDNKPGASGFVAAEMVAKAPPDGHTLLGATEATLVSNNYASSGNGGAFHLGMEMFKRMAGIDIVHVPFKGSALSVNAMLSGEVQIMLNGTPTGIPLAKSGKLRALAVAGARRSVLAPELPTIAESDLPGFEMSGWFGTVAPAGTPSPVIAKLNSEYLRALHSPEVRERLESFGFEIVGNTPEEFSSRMRSESQRLARVIEESGARPE